MSKHPGTEKKGRDGVAVSEASIPPELLLRRDHNIHYERNGTVYATDGPVGVLKQVVVDEAAGEVADLIVQVDGTDRVVLLPPDLVDKTAGSAVFITVNRVQFAERAASATVFDRKSFTKADPKMLVKNGADARERSSRRAVIDAGRDFVETPVANLLERLDRRAPSSQAVGSAPAASTARATAGR